MNVFLLMQLERIDFGRSLFSNALGGLFGSLSLNKYISIKNDIIKINNNGIIKITLFIF